MITKKRSAKVAVFGAAAALTLSACGGGGEGDVEALPGLDACTDNPNECNAGPRDEGGTVTFLVNQGHDAVYNHLRPEGGSVYLLQMLTGIEVPHDGVGYFAPDGEWTWDFDVLAEEPEILSEDPLTVQYVISDDAIWDDETPIDIDDVLWNWYHNSGYEEHCEGCDPRATSFHDETASIEGSDDGKTITITYNDGFVHPEWYARALVSYPAHVATAEVGDWQNDPAAMGESSLYFLNTIPHWSGGPYVVESWTPDERLVMVPNPNWYGETQPTLETIVKEVISDQPSWIPAMSNREIDGGTPASFTPDLAAEIGAIPGVHTGFGSAGAVWEHVDVNMDSLDDPALRKAIFTALDTADARERIFGDLEELPPYRTNHVFPEASPFHEDLLTETGYGTGDLEAARQILEDAGYTGYEEGGTLTDPSGEPVQDIRFAFLAGNENRNTYTQLAQSYLADIGITVSPEAIPGDRLGTVLGEADFDLVIFGWSGSPLFVNSPHQFYHSESGSNFGRVSNAELDTLVSDMRNQLEVEESAAMAQDAVRAIMDEAYSLPLWDTLNFMFVSEDLANLRDNHNTSLRSFYNVEEWGVLAAE